MAASVAGAGGELIHGTWVAWKEPQGYFRPGGQQGGHPHLRATEQAGQRVRRGRGLRRLTAGRQAVPPREQTGKEFHVHPAHSGQTRGGGGAAPARQTVVQRHTGPRTRQVVAPESPAPPQARSL